MQAHPLGDAWLKLAAGEKKRARRNGDDNDDDEEEGGASGEQVDVDESSSSSSSSSSSGGGRGSGVVVKSEGSGSGGDGGLSSAEIKEEYIDLYDELCGADVIQIKDDLYFDEDTYFEHGLKVIHFLSRVPPRGVKLVSAMPLIIETQKSADEQELGIIDVFERAERRGEAGTLVFFDSILNLSHGVNRYLLDEDEMAREEHNVPSGSARQILAPSLELFYYRVRNSIRSFTTSFYITVDGADRQPYYAMLIRRSLPAATEAYDREHETTDIDILSAAEVQELMEEQKAELEELKDRVDNERNQRAEPIVASAEEEAREMIASFKEKEKELAAQKLDLAAREARLLVSRSELGRERRELKSLIEQNEWRKRKADELDQIVRNRLREVEEREKKVTTKEKAKATRERKKAGAAAATTTTTTTPAPSTPPPLRSVPTPPKPTSPGKQMIDLTEGDDE